MNRELMSNPNTEEYTVMGALHHLSVHPSQSWSHSSHLWAGLSGDQWERGPRHGGIGAVVLCGEGQWTSQLMQLAIRPFHQHGTEPSMTTAVWTSGTDVGPYCAVAIFMPLEHQWRAISHQVSAVFDHTSFGFCPTLPSQFSLSTPCHRPS